MKNYKIVKILLKNKPEPGGFINIFEKSLGEILGTEKCDLCKG